MRKRALAALGLLVLAVVPVMALRAWFDPSDLRLRATEAVRRATGRELTIDGPLTLVWSPLPRVRAEDVHLSNPPGLSRPDMARARSIEAGVALWPLLSGRVRLVGVTLTAPDVVLERDAAGQPNWRFIRPPSPPGPAIPTPGSAPHRPLELDGLEVTEGRLVWRTDGRELEGLIPAFSIKRDGADVSGQIVLAGQAVAVSGQMDAVHLVGIGADLTLRGWPASPALTGEIANLAQLSPLAGVALPPLRDIRVAAEWGEAGLRRAEVHAGASDVGAAIAGLKIDRADLAFGDPAQDDQQGHIGASGTWNGAPVTLAARVAPTAGGVALRGLQLNAAPLDVAGDLALDWRARLALRGSIVSRHVDWAALRGLDRPPAVAPPAPPRASSSPASKPSGWTLYAPLSRSSPPSARLFSDTPLPFAKLNRADIDVQVSADEVLSPVGVARAVQGRIRLQDGHLRIDPLQFQTAGGPGMAQFEADAVPARASLVLKVPGLAVETLAAAFGAAPGASGTLDLDVALRGAGGTPHALAGTAAGHVGVAVVQGSIDYGWLGGDALQGAGLPLDPRDQMPLRCLAVRADFDAGIATLRTAALDSPRLRLTGQGTARLADETMDVHLRALAQLGGTAVSVPVLVEGNWDAPRARVDSIEKERVVIGATPPPDPCPAALLAARDGRTGPMPADAPRAKPPKPADLLRSLFR